MLQTLDNKNKALGAHMIGHTIDIYIEPHSREHLEGRAVVVDIISADEGDMMAYGHVRFLHKKSNVYNRHFTITVDGE